MTTSRSTESSSAIKSRGGVPIWVAVVLVLAVLGGSGYGVWKFWRGLQSSGGGAVVSLDEKPSEYRPSAAPDRVRYARFQREEALRARQEAELNGPDYVRERRGQGGIEAKGGKTRLVGVKLLGGAVRISLEPMEPGFVTNEQRQIIGFRNRVVPEDAMARQFEITPEQRTALRAVAANLGYTLDPATRKNFETLCAAWESSQGAAREAAANALTAAVREFEAKNKPVLAQSLQERVDKIKSIVSAEQLKKYASMG